MNVDGDGSSFWVSYLVRLGSKGQEDAAVVALARDRKRNE